MKSKYLMRFVLGSLVLIMANEPVKSQTLSAQDICLMGKGSVYSHTSACTEVITQNPDLIEIYSQRIQLFISKQDLKNAKADLKILMEREPNHSKVYMLSGLIHTYSQDYSSALLDYSKAIELAVPTTPLPVLAQLYLHRAETYLQLKQKEDYIADLNQSIDYFSKISSPPRTFIRALTERKRYWLEEKNYVKAIEDINQVMQLMPQGLLELNERASLWLKLKEFDKAIEDHSQLHLRMSEDPWPVIERAKIWLIKKDSAKALSDLNLALSLSQKLEQDQALYSIYQSDIYFSLAWLYATQTNFKQAQQELKHAAEQDPQNEQYLFYQGWIAYLEGDLKTAKESLFAFFAILESTEETAEWIDNFQSELLAKKSWTQETERIWQNELQKAKKNDLKALNQLFQLLLS